MNRANEIRKRIAKRKREKLNRQPHEKRGFILPEVEEQHGFERLYSYEGGPEKTPTFFRKEVLIFKILASACLFLLTAILFKSSGSSLDYLRTSVTKTFEDDFKFAAVSEWYEEKFGEPLAFFPSESADDEDDWSADYAVPASGRVRVLESFEVSDQGITIETAINEPVKAVKQGVVIFAGSKEETGQTVIIQHSDDSYTWYGQLKEIEVSYNQRVPMGEQVGTVSDGNGTGKGKFYFAIKKGDEFIDPIQVISFE